MFCCISLYWIIYLIYLNYIFDARVKWIFTLFAPLHFICYKNSFSSVVNAKTYQYHKYSFPSFSIPNVCYSLNGRDWGAIVEIVLSTISFNDLDFMHTPRLTINNRLLLIRYMHFLSWVSTYETLSTLNSSWI